jgi:hypothetical protein
VKQRREELGLSANAMAIWIIDTYSTHLLPFVRDQCTAHGIIVKYVVPGYTGKLQAQDIAVNNPFKGVICFEMTSFFEGQVLNLVSCFGTQVVYY